MGEFLGILAAAGFYRTDASIVTQTTAQKHNRNTELVTIYARRHTLNKARDFFKTKAPFIATQLNSTQLDVELS